MLKRERARRASLETARAQAIKGRARPRRALRLDLESLEHRQLLTSVSEFPLRSTAIFSQYIAVGSDKNIWFTLSSNNIGRVNPQTNKVDQFPIPTPNSIPEQIINGPDGNLWFLEVAVNQFGVVNPTTGAITEVPILAQKVPTLPLSANTPEIEDITAGPDGNIWYTEPNANKIGMINPTTHAVQEFAIPTANSQPFGITKGPDGNIWFTESANKVGMINPTTHVIVDYTVASGNNVIQGITAGSDGNLYFTMAGVNQIGKINPTSPATVSTFAIPTAGAQPLEITSGPDGSVWFTEHASNQYGAIDVTSGRITEYPSAARSAPLGIVNGGDGNLWAGLSNEGLLAKVSTAGVESFVVVPTLYNTFTVGNSTVPPSIQAASNGNLYFVEAGAQLGTYNTATHLGLPIALPTSSTRYQPAQIAVNPTDGSLWFTENGPASFPFKIGRLDPNTGVITDNRTGASNGVGAQGITFDAKYGLFFFAESTGNRLGSIDPATNAISETFPTLPAGSNPYGVAAGAAGRVWFTESGTGMVGAYDPSAPQTVIQVALPAGSAPQGIILGPDNNFWVVETAGASRGIAVIDPRTATVSKQIAAPANGSITVGPDGAIWFAEDAVVGRIDPTTFALTAFPATNATPLGVVAGKDGNLYFTGVGTSTPPYYPNVIGSVDLAPAATATQLSVTTQPPADVTAGQGFGLIVAVNNASGQADTFYNGPVTVRLGANPGGSTLSGNLTATAVNGVASFPGLSLNNAGSGYTIQATVPGLAPVTSSPFRVSQAATHLVVITQPPAKVGAGVPFTVIVAAEDGAGNIDTSFNGPIKVALGNNPAAGTLGGTTLLGANYGVASFTGLTLRNAATGYTLKLTDLAGVLATTTTAAFSIGNKTLTSDFDGDGKADAAVYGKDPSTGKYDFRIVTSSSGFNTTKPVVFDNFGYGFGGAQSIPVPGDYFGDGQSAYALWYPNAQGGMTFTAISSVNYRSVSVNFGGVRDTPVVADVDGDGKADFGVYGYDPNVSYRFDFLLSSKGFDAGQQYLFNGSGGYGNAQAIPVVADFDGSGKAGFGLYIPSGPGAVFFYASPASGANFSRAVGGPGDLPTAVDYDGDGKADLALYGPDPSKPTTYRYLVLTSGSNFDPARTVTFNNYGSGYGNASSTPIVADYEGTGKADFGVYLPSARGMQFIYQTSQTGAGVVLDFATTTDLPLTAPTFLLARKVRGY